MFPIIVVQHQCNSWLHYDEARDLAFCHVCMAAQRDGRLSSSTVDKAFIVAGFPTGKTLPSDLKITSLQDAIVRLWNFAEGDKDISELLSEAHSKEERDNRECLLKILSSVRFLVHQGLASVAVMKVTVIIYNCCS